MRTRCILLAVAALAMASPAVAPALAQGTGTKPGGAPFQVADNTQVAGINALLTEANNDLAANNTAGAQDALQRAATLASTPPQDPSAPLISQAQAALSAGDQAGAIKDINAALSIHRG